MTVFNQFHKFIIQFGYINIWRIQVCKKMYRLTSVSAFAPTSFLIFGCGGRHDKAIFDVFFGIRQSLFSHHDLSASAESEAAEAEAEASKKRKISSLLLKYRRRTKVSGNGGLSELERLFRAALCFNGAHCSEIRTFYSILIFAPKAKIWTWKLTLKRIRFEFLRQQFFFY